MSGAKFSLTDLTEQLSVSRKTLYNYFDNRENLLEQLSGHYFLRIQREVSEIVSSNRDYVDRGRDLIGLLTRTIGDLEILSHTQAIDMEQINRLTNQTYKRLQSILEQYIRQGQDRGSIKSDINPTRVADLFIILFKGDISFAEDDANRRTRFLDFTRMIFNGIVADGADFDIF